MQDSADCLPKYPKKLHGVGFFNWLESAVCYVRQHAFLFTRAIDTQPILRAQVWEQSKGGVPLPLPPVWGAEHLCATLERMDFCLQRAEGISAFPPSEITAFAAGTGTPLLNLEYEALIILSKAYVKAFHAFDGVADAQPPYTIETAG